MSFFEAIVSVFKNYANFKGRARRREYWYFSLLSFLVIPVGLLVEGIFDREHVSFYGIAIILIYIVATIIPNLSVTCRRLHDVGKSGAYMFFFLLPILGEILMWVWAFEDGEPWTNRYGPDPKGREMGYGGYAPRPAAPRTEEKPGTTPSKKRCSSCGSEIDINSKYCPNCGNDTRVIKPKFVKDEDGHESGSTSGESRLKGKGFKVPTDLD